MENFENTTYRKRYCAPNVLFYNHIDAIMISGLDGDPFIEDWNEFTPPGID